MKISAGILAGALALAAGSQASAAVLTATATSNFYSSFEIGFTDVNNNGRFDLSEEGSFNGVIFDTLNNTIPYLQLFGVPVIEDPVTGVLLTNASVLDGFGETADDWPNRALWLFGDVNGASFYAPRDSWTYSISGLPDTAVIPLPAGLPLLLAGLGALALLRRRRVVAA